MTRKSKNLVRLVALSFVLPAVAFSAELKREMTVYEGPEKVFSQPVGEIEPALQGAKPTGRNGRVGNEFVFWGYRLASRKAAFLYACLPATGVDCTARRALICDRDLTVISEHEARGSVQKLDCQPVCEARVVSSRPCCTGGEVQLG
ncbi:MAG: hypothetical protein WAW96_13760, partial [Alphaproteobacteria bacterium]